MTTFELNGHEYVELNKLLKLTGVAETGGQANLLIEQGAVKVNEVIETRKRNKLKVGDRVTLEGINIIISQ